MVRAAHKQFRNENVTTAWGVIAVDKDGCADLPEAAATVFFGNANFGWEKVNEAKKTEPKFTIEKIEFVDEPVEEAVKVVKEKSVKKTTRRTKKAR